MLTIAGVRIDDPQRPYIIAEASANHGHDLAKAAVLIELAAQAGADAIKFQTFTADEIAAPHVPLPPEGLTQFWHLGVRTLRDLFRLGGLPRAWHHDLQAVAADHGITFLSTPFSVEAAQFLVETCGVPALKIASGDLTFTPLLEYAASTGLPLLVSTGGATRREVTHAVSFPLHPAYQAGRLALLHCRSLYPCPEVDAGLRVLETMQQGFPGAVIGYSDHTLSDLIPALAVAMGSTLLEKHLAVSQNDASPDAGHSLDPQAFARMVAVARHVPTILGDGRKEPLEGEQHDRQWARRASEDWKRPVMAVRRRVKKGP